MQDLKELSPGLAINSLYMILCTCLLFFCLLGVSLFYSGLIQRRSSLLQLALPLLITPFIFIDWFIWGYSLCYSSARNGYIGSLDFAVLRQLKDSSVVVYSTPRGDILSITHFLFNVMFKIICVAFTFPGCIAERGRILPMLLFLFIWSALIYNPVTYWFWNRNGWLSMELGHLPVLDFAGGNCIHVVSGFTALAYSYILGPRNPKILYNYKSSSNGLVLIGTVFVIFGWLGFIAGCDYKFSANSIFIITNTVLSSCVSALVWGGIDYYYSSTPLDNPNGSTINCERRKMSIVSLCSGFMTGLVVVTPAGGYIASPAGFWKSIIFGIIGGITGNLSTRLKFFFHIDDAFDVFAIHGIGGWVGSLLTGIFADNTYGSKGGWVQGHFIQICYQLLGSTMTSVYVFVMSLVLLYLIDLIPGCHLRIDKNFNKRLRQQTTNRNQVNKSHNEDDKLEQWELLGGDNYELNGEYMMDFMEYIKVVKPEDFEEADVNTHSHYFNHTHENSQYKSE